MIHRRPCVLVVDDDRDLREAIADDFEKRGYETLVAGGGHEAFEVIQENMVDVVLTDVRMPRGDGLELLDKIKNRDQFLPIVLFISGFMDVSLREAYMRGVDAVFSKPYHREALFRAVDRAIQPSSEKLRRKETRVLGEFPVGVSFPTSGLRLEAKAHNLGRMGMFVFMEKEFCEVGQGVDFQLISHHRPITTILGSGVVRWVRKEASRSGPSGCGIEFFSLAEENFSQFIEMINRIKTE